MEKDAKDPTSDIVDNEDIPSDFFDDFSKEDFIEGLSVVDSTWDEDGVGPSEADDKRRDSSITEVLDSVNDLRELIREGKVDNSDYDQKTRSPKSTDENLDQFIKPGSRRDPNKTNEAIKRDKEVKVKQFLSKSLEATDDLRPPGTELDDYYSEEKGKESRRPSRIEESKPRYDESKPKYEDSKPRYEDSKARYEDSKARYEESEPRYEDSMARYEESKSRYEESKLRYEESKPRYEESKPRYEESKPRYENSKYGESKPKYVDFKPKYGEFKPKYGEFKPRYEEREYEDRRYHKGSPPRYHRSPRPRHSPRRSPRPSQRGVPFYKKRSPIRFQPRHRSPQRYRHSPDRHSVYASRMRHHSPQRQHSRSPYTERQRHSRTRSRSRSRSRTSRSKDNFLYPNDNSGYYNQPDSLANYPAPMSGGYPVMGQPQDYNYQQSPAYSAYPNTYNYGVQAPSSGPVQMSHHGNMVAPPLNPVPPLMVPAPAAIVPAEQSTPYNALAQLVAEGKISQEDYLKLAPNKGAKSSMDTKDRIAVLNECCSSLTKLDKLRLPNSLIMNKHLVATEPKSLAPKYCSPLKRQASIDFSFTKIDSSSSAQQNKQLIESIITTLGLENVVSKLKKKKQSKDMKDASVQTSTPFCDICEIRGHSKFFEATTSTEPEYFTSTVHTQVVEQDLVNSKSIFNPTGSAMDNAPISIAHLTPAQLVSQLAARAKTLKQSDPQPPPQNPYGRRYPNYDYDDRGGRGGGQYHNNYNNYNNY